MSDIHREFGSPVHITEPPPMTADKNTVLVLAGDIDLGDAGIKWAGSIRKKYKEIIYVPGNHEYYRQNMVKLDPLLAETAKAEGVTLLMEASVVIDGKRFIGGTMWTDMGGGNPNVLFEARATMNDYHVIRNGHRKLRPEDTVEIHRRTKQFIFEEIDKSAEPCVVVTHHLPTYMGYPEQYAGHRRNAYYVTEMFDLIKDREDKILAWFHGHNHTSVDAKIGKVRLLSNQYGYHNHEVNRDFNPCAQVYLE
jgi:hypothetical protein